MGVLFGSEKVLSEACPTIYLLWVKGMRIIIWPPSFPSQFLLDYYMYGLYKENLKTQIQATDLFVFLTSSSELRISINGD